MSAKPADPSKDSDSQKEEASAILVLKKKTRERVIYPRKSRIMTTRNPVTGGTPITEEQAVELRKIVFGCSVSAPRGEWLRTGLVFREPEQELGYGLKAPRNGTRGLLSVVQAHIIKHLLFEKRGKDQHPRPDMMLKPTRTRQLEALWTAIADILWRVGEKTKCCVLLPQEIVHLPQSHKFLQDGITERLNIFEFTDLEDLQIFIKRYIYLFEDEPGPGSILILYSAVFTRGIAKVKTDLDLEKGHLVTAVEEGSHCIVTLLLTGRATPYLHNGVVYVGDEDHYAMPQFGVLTRSEVGFLVWDEGAEAKVEESRQPGSRLKTPSLPVWVSSCTGHYGVLFNTNRELLRNYHAERRFDLHYYSCGGSHSLLSVDTRYNEETCTGGKESGREDYSSATPLEKLVHTKIEVLYEPEISNSGPTASPEGPVLKIFVPISLLVSWIQRPAHNLLSHQDGKTLMYTGWVQLLSHDVTEALHYTQQVL